MSVDIYTTAGSGTHNFPSAGTAIVECWGGGQGGENGSSIPNESGDGGAGGSYSKRTFSVTSTGYSYYIGNGGAASAPPSGGDVGEDSWFESDTLQLAKGGGAGSGNIGDVTYTGGTGGARAAVKAGGIGGGGGSSAGSAANGNNGTNGAGGGAGGAAPTDGGAGGNGGASGGAGSAGSQPGGGGGGGGNGGAAGGAGGNGKIVVTFTADPTPPPPPPPEPPPPEPPPPDDTEDDQPHRIIIRDKTGRLPKNPKHWPAGLKAAIAGCCGCDESSSSSVELVDNPCCPETQLPSVLRGNMINTLSHDTGLNFRFFRNAKIAKNPANDIRPAWIPHEAFPVVPNPVGPIADNTAVWYRNAWYSDLIFDFECNVNVSGLWQDFGFPVPPPPYPTAFNYSYQVFYYVVFGWDNIEPGNYLDLNNGLGGAFANARCSFSIIQVCYPTGTWSYTNPTIRRTFTFPIDYRNSIPFGAGGLGGVRGIGGDAEPPRGIEIVTSAVRVFGSGTVLPPGLQCAPYRARANFCGNGFSTFPFVTQCPAPQFVGATDPPLVTYNGHVYEGNCATVFGFDPTKAYVEAFA